MIKRAAIKQSVIKLNSRTLLKYSYFILVLAFFCSCTVIHKNHQETFKDKTPDLSAETLEKINLLRHELTGLGDSVDPAEAKQLAETSISYSLYLAGEYRIVRPPYFHNILVRLGVKGRGLCYHWTDDLMKQLTSLGLKSFEIHEGVAYKGSDFREHNTVIVTPREQGFYNGIVLDPWRNSGDLYWGPVKADKYPWEKR